MKPWIPVAVVILLILAFLARRLWHRARDAGPIPFTGGDPAIALAGLLRVTRGTQIDVVGGTLAYLTASSHWRSLLSSWVNAGAGVRYLVANAEPDAVKALAPILAGKPGSLVVRSIRDAEQTAELRADVRDFHFVICESPPQLWLSGRHDGGSLLAFDCEYIPGANLDERWAARRADFDALLAESDPVELTA